jgi:hypothetical protein
MHADFRDPLTGACLLAMEKSASWETSPDAAVSRNDSGEAESMGKMR